MVPQVGKSNVYIFLTVGIISVLCFGWSLKPYQLIDTEKSYLTCPDGTKHSFDSLDIYFYSKRSFSNYETAKAIGECNKHLKKEKLVTDPSILKILNKQGGNWEIVKGDPYPTDWIYKTKGSWVMAIKLWVFGSLIVFLIFNIIKQSLLYIVYGKKFTLSCRKES